MTVSPQHVPMNEPTATIDTYLAGYCEPDGAERAAYVNTAWNRDGRLVDPPLEVVGQDALNAVTDAVLAHYAGHRFRRTSGIDMHHGFARYAWELVASDGSVTLAGTDFAEFDDTGLLRRVVGFFGDLPAITDES